MIDAPSSFTKRPNNSRNPWAPRISQVSSSSQAVPALSADPKPNREENIDDSNAKPPPSRIAHEQAWPWALPLLGAGRRPVLGYERSSDRGVKSTIYDKIAESKLVPAAVMTFLRYYEGRTAYSTASFVFQRAEGTIFDYTRAPDGAQMLWESIRNFVSRKKFVLYFLSNGTVEDTPDALIPTISGAVRQVIVGKVRSQFAEVFSDFMRTDAPAIIGDALGTQGAEIVRDSLREKIDDIFGTPLRVRLNRQESCGLFISPNSEGVGSKRDGWDCSERFASRDCGPNASSEVAVEAGTPAPPSSQGSSSGFDFSLPP